MIYCQCVHFATSVLVLPVESRAGIYDSDSQKVITVGALHAWRGLIHYGIPGATVSETLRYLKVNEI